MKTNTFILHFLTAIAFLFHLLIPFFAVYPVTAANASSSYSVVDNDSVALIENNKRIFVCTSDGFKWLSLDEIQFLNDLDNEENPNDHGSYSCPLCYVTAYKYLDLARLVLVEYQFMPVLSLALTLQFDQYLPQDLHFQSYHTVRGPPTFS